MNDHDDTKQRTVEIIAPMCEGHYLCRTEDGTLANVATYEHCETHHPELIGKIEQVSVRQERRDGPPRVASNAYRAGYDRIFGRAQVGEA